MMNLIPSNPLFFPTQPLSEIGDYSIAVRNPNGSVTIRNYHPDNSRFLTVVISPLGKITCYWSI